MTYCAFDGCPRFAHARGWCGTHYQRWRRLGTVQLTPYVTPPCAVDDCDRDSYSNGLCVAHYLRVRKRGTTELPPQPTLSERVWSNYTRRGDCWIWSGEPGQNGYGRISVGNRETYAHRVSYELAKGPIPDGLQIDHLCRNRLCVNPDHLEPVTLAENVRRGAESRKAASR